MLTQMTKMEAAELIDPDTSETQGFSDPVFLQVTQHDEIKKISKRGRKHKMTRSHGPGSNEMDDEDSDSYSEDIMVVQNEEDQSYLNRVVIGKLSRLGLRDTLWTTKGESFFVIFGFLLTYHSLASFVVEFEKYGAVFIFPYVTVVLLVALPAMYVETALGQFTSSTALLLFDRMSPILMGIGLTSLIYNFMTIVTDCTVLSYFTRTLLASLKFFWDELAYNHCSNYMNNIECRTVIHPTCEDLNREIAKDSDLDPRYRKHLGLRYVAYGDLCVQSRMTTVYQKETDPLQIDKQSVVEWMNALAKNQFMHWDIDMTTSYFIYLPSFGQLGTICLSWLLVYLICSNSQKVVVRTQKISLHFALSAFLTLPVAVLIFKPPAFPILNSLTFNNGFTLETWIRTTILVIRMFKLGQGGYIYIGAQHNVHNPILPDCLIIAAVLTVVPVVYTVVHLLLTDSFLLELVKGDRMKWFQASQNAHRKRFRSTDSQIYQFTLFGMSVSSLGSYESFIMSLVSFCGMMMMISNMITHSEIIVSSIKEYAFEAEDHKLILSTVGFAATLCTFMFKGTEGFFHILSMDNFLLPILGSSILCFEVIAIIIYGPIRFYANLMFISNRRNLKDKRRVLKQYINSIMILLFLVGIPSVAVLQILGSFVDGMLLTDFMQPFTLVIFVIIALVIPAVAYMRMNDQFYKLKDFHGLLSPNRDLWGPRSSADRDVADLVERETRFRGFGDKKNINKKKTK